MASRFLRYTSLLELLPSKSQTCRPLIQVVMRGCLPVTRTLAVFQSSIFQALTKAAGVLRQTLCGVR